MKKRQLKKRKQIRSERILFFNGLIYSCGRKNGKTNVYIKIAKAISSKQYKPYKQLQKFFNQLAEELSRTIIRGSGARQPKGLVDSTTSENIANFREG